jgi:hypothetical protein
MAPPPTAIQTPLPSPARPVQTSRPARRGRQAGALAALGLVGLATAAPAQEALHAIGTPGRAVLQVCRSWIMYDSCNQYGRVDVPGRIAVGDELVLEYGSNPKSMTFPVKLIRFADGVCTLYSAPPAPGTDETKIDKLTISPCRKPGS